MRGDRLSSIAFKQVPWHHYARLSIEQSQIIVRSPFLDNDFVSLAYRAPKRPDTDKQIALDVIAARRPSLGLLETDRGLAQSSSTLSSQVRRRWQQFTFKSEYAWDYGMPQWLARLDHGLASFHPERLFLGRHKFYHFRVWYRDALADDVQEVLLDERTLARPFFNRRRVQEIVHSHVRGTANHTLAIHRLLTCEFIHRQLLEKN
jgi:asparagine synthase (glutamine-hydrolysing)